MDYDVLVRGVLNQTFTYAAEEQIPNGHLVIVPWGKKSELGVVLSPHNQTFKGKTKNIIQALQFTLTPENIAFIKWVSNYNFIPQGMVFKMQCPLSLNELEKVSSSETKIFTPNTFELSDSQTIAYHQIQESLDEFQTMVLDGVTGSGKTNVYFNALSNILEKQKQALVLLPEIGLTKQWIERFKANFGELPYVWHSGVTQKNKREAWNWVLSGAPGIMVGARSSLFLPFSNLGLIVIDEEHDPSYKQEEQGAYNARDMAIVRGKIGNIPIMLASATPSLETMENIHLGKYKHFKLNERFGEGSLPDIKLISTQNMPKNTWISKELHEGIRKRLEQNEQTLLFLNRRGYAPLLLCSSCGYRFYCPGCDSSLVMHRYNRTLICHHCGFTKSIPKECPKCNSSEESLTPCGPGVERIHEIITRDFPQARTLAITSDLMASPKQMGEAIETIENNGCDIIIGTQILAKGHNFENLTLVGVVDADIGLHGTDLRAAERTYHITHQVIGRTGRFHLPGEVIIQTFFPEHPLMLALQRHDRDAFYEIEREERNIHQMPPFSKLVAIIMSGLKNDVVQKAAHSLARNIPTQHEGLEVLGPTPAPISRIRGRYRWRFLVRSKQGAALHQFIGMWIQSTNLPSTIQISLDVDPQSFH